MPDSGLSGPIETAASRPKLRQAACPRCGAEFQCGMNAEGRPCWCAAYPQVMPVPQTDAGCYCPNCLDALAAAVSPAPRSHGL